MDQEAEVSQGKLEEPGIPCTWCAGTGKRTVSWDLGDSSGISCSRCEGSGRIDDNSILDRCYLDDI